jgi:hypothetical protein
VQGSVDLFCENEGEAIKATKQLVDGHDIELWQRDRKIERSTALENKEPVKSASA